MVASVSLLILLGGPVAIAQSAPNALPEAPQPQNQRQSDSDAVVGLRDLPKNLLEDQKAIWTSPLKIRASNAAIPIVLVVGTAAAITTDHEVMSQTVSQNPTFNSDALTASNGMLGVLGAAPVLFYACGKAKNDDHATDTRILAAEAVGGSIVLSEAIKIVARRERPDVDEAKGRFFQPGVGFDSSFASNHAFIAWSAASAIATEYHGPFTMIAAYGLATGVSITRVLGRQHFPSDVFVGSACGWLIGRYVVHRHRHTY
ncbi:MAG: phosphatase PAP2 family protein [Terracidiphilus sp.]